MAHHVTIVKHYRAGPAGREGAGGLAAYLRSGNASHLRAVAVAGLALAMIALGTSAMLSALVGLCRGALDLIGGL